MAKHLPSRPYWKKGIPGDEVLGFLGGGIALGLFGKQTALPATVSTVFMIVYIIWLSVKKGSDRS